MQGQGTTRSNGDKKNQETIPTSSELRCMFMNADVLTNKLAEFELHVKSYQPHIIGVNEVLPKYFRNTIFKEEFNLDNYDMLAHPNVEKNIGRGSILYIHKSLINKPVNLSDSSVEESILAEINLRNNDKLLCGLFYRRGESSVENNNLLLQELRNISNKKYSHILCFGDFNLPGIDWTSWTTNNSDINTYEYNFIETVRDCFLFQHITEPTRCRGKDQPHTLDLIFTNEENMVEKVQIEAPLGKSDHAIIKFNFIADKINSAPQIQTLYNKGNYKKNV